MNGYLRIPVLSSNGMLDGSHRAWPKPIMMLKELEVDRVRREKWRASCDRARERAASPTTRTAKEGGAP